MRKIHRGALMAGAGLLALIAACGLSDEGRPGDHPVDEDPTPPLGGGGEACGAGASCEAGLCFDGVCCDSAANVCGSGCCAVGQACLFEQCVTPGKACNSANDCAPNQYCETGLGAPSSGGTPDAGTSSGVCTQPLPLSGRCIDRPPVCTGSEGSDAGCWPACEYHPPAGGPLSATIKWTWDARTAEQFPDYVDVWSTPTVGRVYDSNCDGKLDELDSPVVVFVSGNTNGSCCTSPGSCRQGIVRMLDGTTGGAIWSLDKATPTSGGFMGLSLAIGDVDGDGLMDIATMTAEGDVAVLDRKGGVVMMSDKPYPHLNGSGGCGGTGWGGGLALADLDGDGHTEIVFGDTVWTTKTGALTLSWTGNNGVGGGAGKELSALADLDGDGDLEVVAGKTAYRFDGTVLYTNPAVPDGFPAIADLDRDGHPEVIVVGGSAQVFVLAGATGAVLLGPASVPGTGAGGPPTVADFDGDGEPEIGVATANYYSVLKPNFAQSRIDVLWKMDNHDYSSSVTGSTVFDFEGDGKAEVVYADECWLWVFDGTTGAVRLAQSHSSFTATEASLVADIDGDGHAEMLIPSQGVSMTNWHCAEHTAAKPLNGHTWTAGPEANQSYRGLTAIGDASNSWVGTRTLWNQHTYHVSNVCDPRDGACDAPSTYGGIPKREKRNWTVPWLNNFRQNVQDKGIFDAPDATVSLAVECTQPVVLRASVRNVGLAGLPAGVEVALFVDEDGVDAPIGKVATTRPLLPGQTEPLDFTAPAALGPGRAFRARVVNEAETFHECREDNNESSLARARCGPS